MLVSLTILFRWPHSAASPSSQTGCSNPSFISSSLPRWKTLTSSYEEMEAPNFFSCIYTSNCLYPQTFLLVLSTLQDQPFCLCSDQYPLRLTHGYFSISCMLSFSTRSSSSHIPTICKHVQASSTIFFFFKLKKHINRITKIFLTIVVLVLLLSSL